MTSVEITAFEAKVIRLAAEGKLPPEVIDGISKPSLTDQEKSRCSRQRLAEKEPNADQVNTALL